MGPLYDKDDFDKEAWLFSITVDRKCLGISGYYKKNSFYIYESIMKGMILMNIGICVYSQTGNTASVAKEIEKKLSAADHNVKIEMITVEGEVKPGKSDYQFKTVPDLGKYDVLVFGSPVQAFSLSSVMSSYLKQIESLQNKKVACFLTKGLPFNWTGGNRAIRQMRKICEGKNAEIFDTGIIKWVAKRREKDIDEIVNRLSRFV